MTRLGPWSILLLMSTPWMGCRAPAARVEDTPSRSRGQCAPELYGAGVFTTGAWDFFMAFSPDQRRVLFGRADDAFERFELFETRRGEGGQWSPPVKPRFAEQWSNADPHLSPDGRSVFFISDRPLPGETGPRASYDIWRASLRADGEWGEATRLPAPVNDASLDEWSPAVAANGNLYFGGERPGTRGGSDLWVSRLVDGVYQPPENLGNAINTAMHELEPWIAPDESYLLFSALRRPDGLGGYDLFLSRRTPMGWERARPLCEGINSKASDYNQSVTPDGKWLYFSSTRPHTGDVGERFDVPRNDATLRGIGNGTGDIYRVPMSALGL
ncbi:Xaa-Pro aminopeptidase [Pyxidicoccus fallax]|uniref:Xaa-Pro aminopeptidase n=1 Tax=Pyxidicoccus fallax TaxID=394095 RepID=A0A848L4Q9_9BACT|nr:PD40 domain-containing protein [Pyxidicoccus fallax]NMO13649.1 Xaa-Pro aminopeptidase [Pyxidicoccus fallax]NPC76863.1 Xaa-Pro aminopeptidase [Pyxidicoccus fallax]